MHINIFDSSPEWCRYLLTQSPLTKRITWIRRLLRGEMCDNVQPLMHCQISCNGGGRDSRKWANYLPLWKKCLRKLLLPIFRLIRGHPWSSFLLIQLFIRSLLLPLFSLARSVNDTVETWMMLLWLMNTSTQMWIFCFLWHLGDKLLTTWV